MFRRRRNQRNNNRSTKRRGARLARTRNGLTQRGNGVSRQDNVNQVRKLQFFNDLPYTNASTDYAIGLTNINLQPKNSPLKELLDQYKGLYEQYRIRRVRIRAQVGKGYTNDQRIQTLVGCRVDVDRQIETATVANVQSINCAENTVIKTFTERGNVLLADYRPQNRMINEYMPPMLPNRFQYFPIQDAPNHRWKGATVTTMLPDPSIMPNSLGITIITEVDIEFRGRVTQPVIFSDLQTINLGEQPESYDIEESQEWLRTGLLTGVLFPMSGFESINIANIGHTVTPEEIMGAQFRIQQDMTVYSIAMYNNDTWTFGANLTPVA